MHRGEPRRRKLEQHLELRIVAAADPAEDRFQRARLQNSEQLVELHLWRAKRRVFQCLEQLPERLGIAHQLAQLRQSLLLGLENLGRAAGGDAGFAKQVGGVSVLRGREKDQEEIIEKSADLLAHSRILVRFEDIQQRRDYSRPQVGRELALDLALEVLDFAVVEEVERGVKIIELRD